MKLLLLTALLVSGAHAATFTVNDGVAGQGTIDIGREFGWAADPGFMNPVKPGFAPFDITGQFPNGDAWTMESLFAIRIPAIIDEDNNNRYRLGISFGDGNQRVVESLIFEANRHTGVTTGTTIGVQNATINETFTPDQQPPSQTGFDALAYLFAQIGQAFTSVTTEAVPEPTSYLLWLVPLGILVLWRRK